MINTGLPKHKNNKSVRIPQKRSHTCDHMTVKHFCEACFHVRRFEETSVLGVAGNIFIWFFQPHIYLRLRRNGLMWFGKQYFLFLQSASKSSHISSFQNDVLSSSRVVSLVCVVSHSQTSDISNELLLLDHFTVAEYNVVTVGIVCF